jgi:hypothetical protein
MLLIKQDLVWGKVNKKGRGNVSGQKVKAKVKKFTVCNTIQRKDTTPARIIYLQQPVRKKMLS